MELEVNFYKSSTRTHIADMSSNARELRGTVAWGQTSSQKENMGKRNCTFGAAVTFTRWQDDRKCGEYNH